MNPIEWTNAVKAGVITAVNAAMGLILAFAVFFNWDVSLENYAVLSLAIETFVNTLLALWVLYTYRASPSRATPSVLESRGMKP